MNAIIFAAQGVQDQEFFYPYYRLREAKWNVDVIISGKLHITGKYGIPIKHINGITSSVTYDDFYDLVIVPGGWEAPEIMRQDECVLEFLKYADEQNMVIGAICHGPQVLISADIVKNRAMTCYKGMKDDLVNAGAHYMNQPVVIDKNIITAPHYDNNPEWMEAILQQFHV
jgi:protease I